MEGHVGGLRVDFVAEDAGLINAEARLSTISEFGARGEECVVADGLEDGELRSGNTRGKEFGAGVDRDSRVHGASDDLRGNGDFGERVRRKGRTDGWCHGENGADARVAMRFGVFDERRLDGGISLGESCDFGEEAGVLDRIGAHAVGFGRFAKVLIAGELRDAAGEFEDGEATERKAGCTDALGVNAWTEGWVGKELIEKGTQVVGALTPEDRAGNCVVFQSVIARMIYGGGDETMRGEHRAEPRHHVGRAANAMGEEN